MHTHGTAQILPVLPVPVVPTRDVARLTTFYRVAIGFEVLQWIPGVVALLACGPLRVQLWQRPDAAPAVVRVPLTAQLSLIEVHAALARHASSLLQQRRPCVQSSRAWDFDLIDLDGNRLKFVGPQYPCQAANQART